MGPKFTWRDEFLLGVDVIDKEHQRLFKIINKLFDYREAEKDAQWTCQEGIKFFKGHTLKHFIDEEAYMASIQYAGLERHRRIHKGFCENTLPALEQELEQSNYAPDAVDHFLGVCAGWLIGHTLTEDLSITGKGTCKWEKLLPGEELTAIRKVVTQLVFDMFRLESHLISDAYGGEKFGCGIYYRFVYESPHCEKRQEILLVLEEKLLIGTVGKVLGIETNELDSMLIHASRYTARQFAERVLKQIPSMQSCELKEENFLSYEQFQRIFEKEKVQASLLFNTGAGYFAFCLIAPHLLENGTVTPLAADNAMAEVEKFLSERKAHSADASKPRVLLVDDSLVVQQSICRLLNEDYDVSTADSGVAAIRTITLNRPDLVLLDYEMPICDGKQTLEMLRSEPSFADIPVIFLTSKSDPESVRQVMSLRPAGYLLKTFKPEEIRKKINAFFEKQKKA